MGALVSLFMSKITRTKTQDEDDEDSAGIDFLKLSGSRRNLQLPNSIKMLTGACFNCAVFVVIGLVVKNITGPAMLFSIILGAAVAMLNNLALAELCSNFQSSTSFYAIIYKDVGELCAFMVGWLRLLQSIFMISVVSVAAGDHIRYLLKPVLNSPLLTGYASWIEVPPDDLVFIAAFLAIVSLVIAAGLPQFSVYITTLFVTNIAVFLFMLVVIIFYASSINWSVISTKFQPFNFYGTIQGVALTTFFFTRLDKVVEQGVCIKNGSNILPVSLIISLLTVSLYYLCSTLFVTILAPFDKLSNKATIPKLFSLTTFPSSKYILSAAAIVVFCLTIIESYFDAQKLFNLMAEDRLVCRHFINWRRSRHRNRIPPLSVFITTILAIPLFLWLPLEKLIQGFCIVSLMISIVINCTAIVVQYRPLTQDNEKNSGLVSNWESIKYCIIRFILCCGYITHKRVLSAVGVIEKENATEQTSKAVNWLVLSYIPSCIGLALAMFHGLPVHHTGLKLVWIVIAAIGLLTITLFLTISIILIHPRSKEKVSLFGSNFLSSFVPLLNVSLLSVLLISFEWIAFAAVGAWLGLGLFIYFLYGISHSEEALFNKSQELNTSTASIGRVRFDSAPQLDTSFTNVQPDTNVDNSEQFLFSEDAKLSFHHYPQKY